MKDDADILEQAFDRWKDAREASRKWRQDAIEDFDFYAGRQWDSGDLAFLREARRPVITMNRSAPFVDAIVGTEVNNRQETAYLPQTTGLQDKDGAASEMFTIGGRWIRQQCDAEDNETQAYKDCLITGMGWSETRVDYSEEPDGKVLIERVSPLEMYWTAGAARPNLQDATDFWRVRLLPVEEVKQRWPDLKMDWGDIESWADTGAAEPHDATPPAYDQDTSTSDETRAGMVRVVQYQWCDRESYLRTVDPSTGDNRELNPDKLDEFRASAGEDHPVTRQSRKRWYQAFIVGKALAESGEIFPAAGESCPGATFKCVTGKRDETEKAFYGVMRAIKDPQRWANKFFSQIQDVINSNAKGGVIAETDAFENIRQAEENWAKPDTIIWASPGAVTGGKIIDRKPAAYPTGLDRLMQVAIESIQMTSGVSLEMLGVTGTNQPNVLERTRIGRSLAVLAEYTSSLRGYRKSQGRLLLYLMRHFLPAGVLGRATGHPDVQQLLASDIAKFDVVVDQSPTSPNIKEEVWAALIQGGMLQTLLTTLGKIPMTLIKFLPFPDSVIRELMQELQQQAQDPMAQAQKQLGVQQQAADVQKTQADAQKSQQTGQAAIMGAKTNLLQAAHEIMSPPEPKPAGNFPPKK